MIGRLAARTSGWPLAQGSMPVLVGLAVPFLYLLVAESGLLLMRFAAIALVVVGWQLLFARIRRQAFGPEGIATAALIALLVPPDAPIWQLLLGASFGIVIGQLIFGGHGRNFLHPAVVALAFLMFSFAGEDYRSGPELPLWTLAPAALVLIGTGQAAWQLLSGAAAGAAALLWLRGGEPAALLLLDGTFWLVLLFLAADPVASAATNWGRSLQGLLVGVLIGLFTQVGAPFGAAVFAVLMASVFAPLIDHGVIALNARRRAARRG